MPITIKDTIPGCGKQWTIPPVLERMDWVHENFQEGEYKIWYGGLHSDDLYIQFCEDHHATMYKFKWCVK